MPLRSDWSTKPCSIARGIEAIGDPWVLLILREAFSGVRRFDDFAVRTGANDKVLASRLKHLVEIGLLQRHPLSKGARPRAEYLLTEAGADALPVLHAFSVWAEKHGPNRDLGSLGISCAACGAATQSADTCRACGRTLAPGNVIWSRGGRWPGTFEVVGLPAAG